MRLTLLVSDATFSGPFLASRVSICVPSVPHAARAWNSVVHKLMDAMSSCGGVPG